MDVYLHLFVNFFPSSIVYYFIFFCRFIAPWMHENNKDQWANTEAGNITVYESHNMVLQQTIFCKLHHYLTLTEKDVFNHLHPPDVTSGRVFHSTSNCCRWTSHSVEQSAKTMNPTCSLSLSHLTVGSHICLGFYCYINVTEVELMHLIEGKTSFPMQDIFK